MAKSPRAEISWAELEVPPSPTELLDELKELLEAGTDKTQRAIWFINVLRAMALYEATRES